MMEVEVVQSRIKQQKDEITHLQEEYFLSFHNQ